MVLKELITYLSENFNLRKINREIERICRKVANKILRKEEINEVTLQNYFDMIDSEDSKEFIKKSTRKRIGF